MVCFHSSCPPPQLAIVWGRRKQQFWFRMGNVNRPTLDSSKQQSKSTSQILLSFGQHFSGSLTAVKLSKLAISNVPLRSETASDPKSKSKIEARPWKWIQFELEFRCIQYWKVNTKVLMHSACGANPFSGRWGAITDSCTQFWTVNHPVY